MKERKIYGSVSGSRKKKKPPKNKPVRDYTGFMTQPRSEFRQNYRQTAPTASESVTTGIPEREEAGLVDTALGATSAYDNIGKAYDLGKNAGKGFDKIGDYFTGGGVGKTWDEVTQRFVDAPDKFSKWTGDAYDDITNAPRDIGNWFGETADDVGSLFGDSSAPDTGSLMSTTPQPPNVGAYGRGVAHANVDTSYGPDLGTPASSSFNPNVNPNFGSQYTNTPASGSLVQGGVSSAPPIGMGTTTPLNYGIQGGSTWADAIAKTGAKGSTLMGDTIGAGSMFAGGDVGMLADGSNIAQGGAVLGESAQAAEAGAEVAQAADVANTGMQTSSTLSQAMPYLKIGYDLTQGSDKLTGDPYGDAAARTAAAIATGGWSELFYTGADLFDWI
jgi:hypothetical protein